MRIVYDDARIGLLTELVAIWAKSRGKNANISKYSYGMERIDACMVRRDLGAYLESHGFEIGRSCDHAHGIGNNNRHPVYYRTEAETQLVGYMNINVSPFGEGYLYVSDYNDSRHGVSHRLSPRRN